MSLRHNHQSNRNENLKEENEIDTSAPQLDKYPMPSLGTVGVQFIILCLAILVHYLREKKHVLILGLRITLLWGVVPAECLIMSGLFAELAIWELGYRYG